jgi:hypothetical protein
MNKTAMQILRDRLQARCESDSCSEYEEIILDGFINCIDTELLEVEKQQMCRMYVKGRKDGHLDYYPEKHALETYNELFNQK